MPKRDTPERNPQLHKDVPRRHIPEQYSKTRYRPTDVSDIASSSFSEESSSSDCEDSRTSVGSPRETHFLPCIVGPRHFSKWPSHSVRHVRYAKFRTPSHYQGRSLCLTLAQGVATAMVTSLDIVIDHQNGAGRTTHVLALAVAVFDFVNALYIAGAKPYSCGHTPRT